MAQLGRALESSESWVSVMGMFFSERLVRVVICVRGEKSEMGLPSRYRVRRPGRAVSGVRSLIWLPERFSVTSPPRADRREISRRLLPAMDRLSTA